MNVKKDNNQPSPEEKELFAVIAFFFSLAFSYLTAQFVLRIAEAIRR